MDPMDDTSCNMDDTEIQEKVESLVGKGIKVVDCEKSTSFQTNEVLLVNGVPVALSGEEGARVKKALMTGQVPPGDLLNDILIRAGILKAPVELETTMNVKSTTKTTELLTLRDKNGVVVDERMKEVEEDNEFQRESKEVWKKEHEKDAEELRRMGKRVEKINVNIPAMTMTKSETNTNTDADTQNVNARKNHFSTSSQSMDKSYDNCDGGGGDSNVDLDSDSDANRGGGTSACNSKSGTVFENNVSSCTSLISPEIPFHPFTSSSSTSFATSCVPPLNASSSTTSRAATIAHQKFHSHSSLPPNLSPNSISQPNLHHPSSSSSSSSHDKFVSFMNNHGNNSPSHHHHHHYHSRGELKRPTSPPPSPPPGGESPPPLPKSPCPSLLFAKTRSKSENNVQLTFMDPSAGTLYAELNGQPVRVSYETFV